MKVVTVLGARPQFIKASAVSRAFAEAPDAFQEVLVHTGQHYDANMSDIFFSELQIPVPAYHLGIGGGSHGQNTGRMLEATERVLKAEKPDLVLVYGDTDSTLAGALASAKLHIPVAHVEAGLRSFNRQMPEEINRVLTDHLSHWLLAPTDEAVKNLAREGIDRQKVHQVGDVMFDVARHYAERANQHSRILERLGLDPKAYILATVHRQENTDDLQRLQAILDGFSESPWPIVWPIHPRTQKRLTESGLALPDTVRLTEPAGYLDMVRLESQARLIATDSGGIQKEAYFHGVPCITLRDETEWVELVQVGANKLVGANKAKIATAISLPKWQVVPEAIYGDGQAARAIVACLRVESSNASARVHDPIM